MGGGDLNSKKSWHPNTMKNQERVWKAEQAAAEEKKRILELQRERGEEKDRAELNDMVKRNSGMEMNTRLNWMYEKPDKKVQEEEYLLGKALDKSNEPERPPADVIPAVSRRVVGSSMCTSTGDTQVDLQRKIKEDPLLLIKERERAARAALLNNPLQRRKLTELLRKEQEKKESKIKKNPKKKKDKDLDNQLAAKLNALGGEKGLDLASLLNSDDSSSDSSEEEKPKKKKKKDKVKKKSKKTKKKRKKSTSSDASDEHMKKKNISKLKDSKKETRRRHSDSSCDESVVSPKKAKYVEKHDVHEKSYRGKQFESEDRMKVQSYWERHRESIHQTGDKEKYRDRYNKRTSPDRSNERSHKSKSYNSLEQTKRNVSPQKDRYKSYQKRRGGLSEEEKAAKLAAMAQAGAEREVERGRRVVEQREADAREDTASRNPRGLVRNEARALPESLESRIHSNRHYIQRDRRHMNEHFARR